jgi:dihydropyrimidinase
LDELETTSGSPVGRSAGVPARLPPGENRDGRRSWRVLAGSIALPSAAGEVIAVRAVQGTGADAGTVLLRGGTVVDSDGARQADVLVGGERIAAVGPGLDAAGSRVVDAGGAYVIPGGIDVHTHMALPVGAVGSADDFESGTLAAACGGTTCIVDFAGAGREPWQEALAAWHERARGKAVIDYGFHLTVTELPREPGGAARRFRSFADEGVTSVKLYMAYPDRLMVDDQTLARALGASRQAGVRVCVHAEDGAAIEALIAVHAKGGRNEIRPTRANGQHRRCAAAV